MDNPFERFNNTEAVIIEITDYADYEGTYTPKEIGRVFGDLQPYMLHVSDGFGLAQKEYGLSTQYTHKFFCNKNTDIIVGRYLVICDKSYRIEYIAPRRLRYEVILKEEKLNGGRERDSTGYSDDY